VSRKFIQCSCYSEGILIEYDDEDSLYYVSFLADSPERFKLSIIVRLRSIWRLLTKGKIYSDQVVLSHKEATALVRFLSDTGDPKESVKTYTVDELSRDAERGIF